MNPSFKFRYVHEITGIFVFFSLIVLFGMIFFAGRLQGWFEPKVTFYTVFSTKEGTFGLQKGGEVSIFNTVIGSVKDIVPNDQGNIEAVFEIKRAFQKFIKSDSKAIIKKKFGIAGDAYLEVIPGTKNPILKEKSQIECVKDTEVMETVREVMEDLREAFLPALDSLQKVLEELPGLTSQMKMTFAEVERFFKESREFSSPFLKDLNLVSNDLHLFVKDAKALVQKLSLWTDSLEKELDPGLGHLKNSFQSLDLLLSGLEEKVDKKKLSEFVDSLPVICSQLEMSLDEMEKVLKGMRSHWLIRKYAEKAGDDQEPLPLEMVK